MEPNPMRVLVADDHSLFRDGIVSLLEAAGYEIVGQAGNGKDALALSQELDPELVLLDISMPEMDGLEVLRRIRDNQPDTKVVILTVSDEDDDLMAAVQAGANGYLHKSLTAERFLDLIQGLERGEAAITRRTTTRLIQELGEKVRPEIEPYESLTGREIDLLHLVASGQSNRAIAQTLSISENTVKYHMKNILQKLHAQNRTEAVTHAMQAGLINPTSSFENS
jgi:DNA-binding NarL/FixJ family response regulator